MKLRKSEVQLPCQQFEMIDIKKVEILGLSESDQGDVATYKCPKCGETHQSKVFVSYETRF